MLNKETFFHNRGLLANGFSERKKPRMHKMKHSTQTETQATYVACVCGISGSINAI